MKDTLLAPGLTRVATPNEFDQLPEHVQKAIRIQKERGFDPTAVLHVDGFDGPTDPTYNGWIPLTRIEGSWDLSRPEETRCTFPEWYAM